MASIIFSLYYVQVLLMLTKGSVAYNATEVYEGDLPCFIRTTGLDLIECALPSFSGFGTDGECHTDSLCRYYGDCCGEYTPKVAISSFPRPDQIECTHPCLKDACRSNSYFMVTKCPSLWIQSSQASEQMAAIRQRCEVPESVEPPVTHLPTGLVYKNRYCALCNNVNINELQEWALQWKCEIIIDQLISHGNPVTINDVDQFCTPVYSVPTESSLLHHQPRACDPSLIRKCPVAPPNYLNAWEYRSLVSNCTRFGMGRVSYKLSCIENGPYPSTTFSNPYCAICNMDGQELDLLDFVANPSRCFFTAGEIYSFTFTFFFGPQADQINEQNNYNALNNQNILVHTNKTCSNGTVYLPNMNICRETVYFDGNGTSDCNYISLNASEYTMIDSVTLLWLADNKTYAVQGFDASNKVIICYDSDSSSTIASTTVDSEHSLPIAILSYLGLAVDVISGLLIFVTYLFCLESRTLYTRVLLNMVTIFVVGDIVLVIGNLMSYSFQNQGFCVALATAIHFTFLARFFSANAVFCVAVRTFYFAWKVIPPIKESKMKHCQYLALCLVPVYFLSAVIVGVCLALNFTLDGSVGYGYRQSTCWMSNVVAISVSFVTPLCLTLLVNTVCFIFCSFVVIRHVVQSRIKTKVVSHQKALFSDFRIIFAFYSVSGISWIFFVLLLIPGVDGRRQVWGSYIFVILNSCQLLLVALAYVCTKKVLKKYYQLFCGVRSRLNTLTSSAGSQREDIILATAQNTTSSV